MQHKGSEKHPVTILSTGGTIEKSYDERDGSLANRQSQLKDRILTRLRLPYRDIHLKVIMNKDSLDLTDSDRQFILQNIQAEMSADHPIVVLHGTDTMDQTLRHCHQHETNPTVPVIFTGAMRPFGFEDSDAQQNLVEALAFSLLTKPGFYLSFHGRLFAAPGVRKNKDSGTFEAL